MYDRTLKMIPLHYNSVYKPRPNRYSGIENNLHNNLYTPTYLIMMSTYVTRHTFLYVLTSKCFLQIVNIEQISRPCKNMTSGMNSLHKINQK